jgi:hypothetical protein
MMSGVTFFLRIVGKAPEQVREKERLKENIKRMDEHDDRLDEITKGFESINRTARKKTADLQKTISPGTLPKTSDPFSSTG